MILTTIFGTAGLCAGGTFGAFADAFDGKPFRYAVICGALAGGVGAAGGYFADHAAGNFDEPAPQVITADQQKSISECFSDAPDGMDSVITLASDGTVKCLYAPK
ncbi:MAG: hypothetical protein CL561_00995 [Alphaproteobacteria bacterium]|nr:hypothetical protein [Alphaproteobacteria bacterium]